MSDVLVIINRTIILKHVVQKKKILTDKSLHISTYPRVFLFFVQDNLCHPPPRWLSNTLLHDGEECASAA